MLQPGGCQLWSCNGNFSYPGNTSHKMTSLISCSLLARKASQMPDAAATDLSWWLVIWVQLCKHIYSNTRTLTMGIFVLNLISRGKSLSHWLGLDGWERITMGSPVGSADQRWGAKALLPSSPHCICTCSLQCWKAFYNEWCQWYSKKSGPWMDAGIHK